SSRRRHTRSKRDWSSDVCSSDLRITDDIDQIDRAYVLTTKNNAYVAAMMNNDDANDDKKERRRGNEINDGNRSDRGMSTRHTDRSEERRVGKESRAV